jgi:SnoaL-like domain
VSPADPPSSYRAIETLIYTYAELVDGGDFAAVGRLFTGARFTGARGSVTGQDAIERMLNEQVILYDDHRPRTKHVRSVAVAADQRACDHVAIAWGLANPAASAQELGEFSSDPWGVATVTEQRLAGVVPARSASSMPLWRSESRQTGLSATSTHADADAKSNGFLIRAVEGDGMRVQSHRLQTRS